VNWLGLVERCEPGGALRSRASECGVRQSTDASTAFTLPSAIPKFGPCPVASAYPAVRLHPAVSAHQGPHDRPPASSGWLKMKNPACAAVRREKEEDWGKERRR
jgi:hypothetical protein